MTRPSAGFLQRFLGFRLSDTVGSDGFFLRCNSLHHGIGLFRGRGPLHHHAWEVQSLGELDEGSFVPRVWDAEDPWWWSRWAEQRPDGFRDHGLRPWRGAHTPEA